MRSSVFPSLYGGIPVLLQRCARTFTARVVEIAPLFYGVRVGLDPVYLLFINSTARGPYDPEQTNSSLGHPSLCTKPRWWGRGWNMAGVPLVHHYFFKTIFEKRQTLLGGAA
jgi:hypothetical protein